MYATEVDSQNLHAQSNTTSKTESPPTRVSTHCVTWDESDVYTIIGDSSKKRFWAMLMHDGTKVRENGGIGHHTILDCFLSVLPNHHLDRIVEMTFQKLSRSKSIATSCNELLKFFVILLLSTRY